MVISYTTQVPSTHNTDSFPGILLHWECSPKVRNAAACTEPCQDMRDPTLPSYHNYRQYGSKHPTSLYSREYSKASHSTCSHTVPLHSSLGTWRLTYVPYFRLHPNGANQENVSPFVYTLTVHRMQPAQVQYMLAIDRPCLWGRVVASHRFPFPNS